MIHSSFFFEQYTTLSPLCQFLSAAKIDESRGSFPPTFVGIGGRVPSAGVGSGTITTYDAPCTELKGRSNAPCTLMVNDVEYDVPARDDLIVSGLNIPPWSTVPVYITAAVACRGRLTYQRGCFSCTL